MKEIGAKEIAFDSHSHTGSCFRFRGIRPLA